MAAWVLVFLLVISISLNACASDAGSLRDQTFKVITDMNVPTTAFANMTLKSLVHCALWCEQYGSRCQVMTYHTAGRFCALATPDVPSLPLYGAWGQQVRELLALGKKILFLDPPPAPAIIPFVPPTPPPAHMFDGFSFYELCTIQTEHFLPGWGDAFLDLRAHPHVSCVDGGCNTPWPCCGVAKCAGYQVDEGCVEASFPVNKPCHCRYRQAENTVYCVKDPVHQAGLEALKFSP